MCTNTSSSEAQYMFLGWGGELLENRSIALEGQNRKQRVDVLFLFMVVAV